MKLLYKILKAKKIFKKPEQKKFLILDSYNSVIFEKYIKKDEFGIFHTRYESLNFFVLIKNIFKLKFNFFDYMIEYIKLSNCKFIVSFYDNNISFYKLKEYFPDKTVIIIQNGTRSEFFFDRLSEKDLKADYVLTFSDLYSEKFKQRVNTNSIAIGSFKNNLIIKKEFRTDKSIAYISDYAFPITSKNKSKNYINVGENRKVEMDKYYLPERELLPILLSFCKKNQLKLKIIARAKYTSTLDLEKKFYETILSPDSFELFDTFKFDNCYKFSDQSSLTVNIQSAFGLESIARGNRTVIFNVRDKATNIRSLRLFPTDEHIVSKGPFWSDEVKKEEVYRTLNYSLNSSEEEWKKTISQIIPRIISFDLDNSKFKQIINEK